MSGARGTLVLVGTPLGNRDDLSPRARAAILGADLLLCEDTRSPLRLLGEGVVLPPPSSGFRQLADSSSGQPPSSSAKVPRGARRLRKVMVRS